MNADPPMPLTATPGAIAPDISKLPSAPAPAGASAPAPHDRAPRRISRLIPTGATGTLILTPLIFLLLAGTFFALVGRPPLEMLLTMLRGAFGDWYSISETLVKSAPILLTALAVALPARMGLISVGAEGQLYLGALFGTALVLAAPQTSGPILIPLMLLFAALGGALWGSVPALLKARLDVNETISSLLLNYIAALLVNYLVFGPWKDPVNLGWPATTPFPDTARLPTYFESRMHAGLLIGIVAATALHFLVGRTRWGITLRVLRSNRKVAREAGLSFGRNALLAMALGGALAGLAGIAEVSVIQGRLQPGISGGMGFSGFLVAWMAGGHMLRIVPLAVILGGLLASGDSLQLFAGLPSSSALVMQGLLFVSALVAGRLSSRRSTNG